MHVEDTANDLVRITRVRERGISRERRVLTVALLSEQGGLGLRPSEQRPSELPHACDGPSSVASIGVGGALASRLTSTACLHTLHVLYDAGNRSASHGICARTFEAVNLLCTSAASAVDLATRSQPCK